MKAVTMLLTNKTLQDRAEVFAKSIKRNLQKKVIDVLVDKKEKLEEQIYEAENFAIEKSTKEECEKKFENLIEWQCQLLIVTKELEVKQNMFDKYFGIIE